MQSNKLKQKGFSLVEMVIGSAVFAVIIISVFQSYSSFISLVAAGKWKILGADIANADFELIRNLPYQSVGLLNGIPSGFLPATSTVVRDNYTFQIERTVRNIDDPFDGTLGGTPNDLSPADYKMVEIYVDCPACKSFTPAVITGLVAPKNLETASTNGALFVRVFDANGVPVPQAEVHIERDSPYISIDDVTDNQGLLALVDAPPGVNAYRISVTKPGFTLDKTIATSSGNPNPSKPHVTILIQQVTQISFVIDQVSTLNIQSQDSQCVPQANVPFTVAGSKLIGSSPDVVKFSGTYSTDSSGLKILPDIEWDTFWFSIGGAGFYLAGTNPIMPVSVLPNSGQGISLVLTSGPVKHLLVAVKDSATSLPISGASLTLDDGGAFSQDLITGRGYMEQTDWSGGPGQDNFVNQDQYFSDDGNMKVIDPIGELTLKSSLGHYVLSGSLTSSIFDTGTSSNFSNIYWNPTAQPPQSGSTSVKFQIATALDNTATTTWDYLGPDGTSGTLYDVSNTNINAIHNGNRYFRYKIYLSTEDDNYTPNVANVGITFTSQCIPPGQAIFSSLSQNSYNLTVSKAGYANQTVPVNTPSSWQMQEINLIAQ